MINVGWKGFWPQQTQPCTAALHVAESCLPTIPEDKDDNNDVLKGKDSKTKIPNHVSSERLDNPKAIHIFVHTMEIPESNMII